jgi:amino acid adenylation domain-containing protein
VSQAVLYSGFLRSAQLTPERPALHVDGGAVTYEQLRSEAASLAATLQMRLPVDAPKLTAVYAERSRTGFAGILGTLLAGHGYVPLNATFPVAQTQRMINQSGCQALIADSAAEAQLDAVLDGVKSPLLVILADNANPDNWGARWQHHVFVGAQDLPPSDSWTDVPPAAHDIAYLLFTSGTTGVPKGIGVTHANVSHFVQTMVERYGIVGSDRFSQMFDATFDLSVFDMFVAWHAGACVYCPSRATLLNPDKFIRDHELTIWFSVPTVGLLMKRLGALKPGRYPSLRWSLFCGEPFPVELARAWTAAAPTSQLENLYGPTELTVACTAYRWNPAQSARECGEGVVPIGVPLRGMRARVVDERLTDVAPGEIGELLVAGAQRAPGYWQDAEATSRVFVGLPGEEDMFYRTGDLVRAPVADGPLRYIGRVDHQVKVLGHRVELEEVESILRQQPGVHQAVAVGWPVTSTGVGGVAAFVTGTDIDVGVLRARVRQKLHSYAVPQTICVLTSFPQNANGKVDRQALVGLLNA